MMTNIASQINYIHCNSEFGKLQKVVVCEPEFMEIKEVINNVQRQYKEQNIDRSLAIEQHQNFVQTLQNAGVEVIKLTPSKDFSEQVFTRDIGFSIGDHLFISEMAKSIRKGEENILASWMSSYQAPFRKFSNHSIEGGDVIVDGQRIFIGLSDRTNTKSIQALQRELPMHDIIPIPFNPKYLHLDCVFNILSSKDALIFSPALDSTTLNMLSNLYDLIEVSESEQFSMGTNVLSIGQNRVFSLPINSDVNHQMRQRGYEILEVDFTEIIKSGGSFRCCTMPLVRD
jgi:N-dimethylarginine dimethylaminohydrolase